MTHLPSRIACVLVPRFPLAVALLTRPHLQGLPVVIGGAPEERKAVVACSPEAELEGVQRGMQLRQALARCRHATFLEAQPGHERDLAERLLDALATISPVVEDDSPGLAYVSLDGLAGRPATPAHAPRRATSAQLPLTAPPSPIRAALFPDEASVAAALRTAVHDATGLSPRIGIADGRFAAWAAAQSTDEDAPRIVPPGGSAAFIATLPVRRLPLADDLHQRLEWLGLRTAGEIAARPRSAFAAQFGPEGGRAWDLATGTGGDPLVPRQTIAEQRDSVVFPLPVAETPGLCAAAEHLLRRLLRRPECADRAVRGLTLTLHLANGHRWERVLTFREPVADPARMHRAISAKLDGTTLSAPAERLTIGLRGLTGETGVQADLFSLRARHQREISDALALLQARFGHDPVMQIVGVEPWSRFPERRYALLPLTPATLASAR